LFSTLSIEVNRSRPTAWFVKSFDLRGIPVVDESGTELGTGPKSLNSWPLLLIPHGSQAKGRFRLDF